MSLRSTKVELRTQTKHMFVSFRCSFNQSGVDKFQCVQISHLLEEN